MLVLSYDTTHAELCLALCVEAVVVVGHRVRAGVISVVLHSRTIGQITWRRGAAVDAGVGSAYVVGAVADRTFATYQT